uniref:Glycoprotein n=1 Tax=Hymenopteran phasma-related virus OKIAV229 TaxID=2746313 RepID=A0A7D7EZ44_9VIRU|nr:glycoprotein [Hymenopteran phasma-related virus OKIAV229]
MSLTVFTVEMRNYIRIIIIMLSVSYIEMKKTKDVNYNQNRLSVHAGKIINPDNLNCSFNINGTLFNSTDFTSQGLYFGLILYESEGIQGHLISKPECTDCGIYCAQNELIIACRHYWLPMIIGIITSIILFSILLMLLYYFKRTIIQTLARIITTRVERNQNRKEELIFTKLNKLMNDRKLEIPNAPAKEEVQMQSLSRRNSDEHLYPTLSLLTAATCLLNPVNACDQTLFMQSNGQICDAFKCQTLNSYEFSIQYGSTICFSMPDGDKIEMYVSDSYINQRYEMAYLTSDFDIQVDSTSRCKQAGECVSDQCQLGSIHDVLPKNKSDVQYFDCQAEGLGCEFTCWHKYACTWYTWWVSEKGPRAKVYKKEMSYWSFKLNIKIKNELTTYQFTTHNPHNTLNFGQLLGRNQLVVNIVNVIHDNIHLDDYLIEDNNTFIDYSASSLNFPMGGKIGDYQISINRDKTKFDYHGVNCRVSGCKVICEFKEPALRTFRVMNHQQRGIFVKNVDKYLVEGKYKTPMAVLIRIGNIDLDSLFIDSARCDISVEMTYGCTGCNSLPYAVLSSNNIVSPGLMSFKSNCSFTSKFLSCGSDPFILSPIKKESACRLWIKNTNSTIDINFKYEFLGGLTTYERTYSIDNSALGIVKSIASNPNFIDGLLWSFSSFTLTTLAMSIIYKLLSRMFSYRFERKIEKDIENSN